MPLPAAARRLRPLKGGLLPPVRLDSELFASYFGRALRHVTREPVPVLKVEGKMFPVQEIWLEEALQHVPDLARAPVYPAQHSFLGRCPPAPAR